MAAITLAKALKLKNRLVGRLNQVQADIVEYNSVLAEKAGEVDVNALLKQRAEITNGLVDLKTKIALANGEIQGDLIRLGELKSELTWIATIPVRDGAERHSYQNTNVNWVATLKKAEVDARKKEIEREIDATQDKLDGYNFQKKVEVPDRTLALGS